MDLYFQLSFVRLIGHTIAFAKLSIIEMKYLPKRKSIHHNHITTMLLTSAVVLFKMGRYYPVLY